MTTTAPRQPRRRPLVWSLAAVSLIAALAGVAWAEPILHEFFIIPADERSPAGGGGAADESPRDTPGAEALSEALREPDTPPPLTIQNRGDEMEMGEEGTPLTASGEAPPAHNGPFDTEDLARPDRKTRLDDELNYFTVFNPSVVPWKRGASRDEVHADYSLGVRDRRPAPIPVADRPVRDGYERFWGSMLVHMRPGQQLPLPSVSPEAEILRYQTEPPTRLEFFKDRADNFFVSGNASGTVRVNFLMEAPQRYFGGEVDPSVQIEDIPRSLRPRLPAGVQASAERAIAAIGVDRQAPLREQLDRLVAWFRAFEAEEFPTDQASQDIYLDLVLNQLGVCRHRAFGFVVTAQALGIPARYIHNEAHAFTEVYIPRRGWLRIDLGGAAVDFQVRNSDDKVLHTPPENDTFTKPENFNDSYSHRLAQGDPQADIDHDGQLDPIGGVPERQTPRLGPGDTPQVNPDAPESELADLEQPGEGSDDAPAELNFPGAPPVDIDPDNATPSLRGSRVQLLRASRSVYRGDDLLVEGALTAIGGEPLSNQVVEAYLVPTGKHTPESFILIGTAQTDAMGKVELKGKIPETVPLGRWSLHLYYRGGGTYLPSHSP